MTSSNKRIVFKFIFWKKNRNIVPVQKVKKKHDYELRIIKKYTMYLHIYLIFCQLTNYNGTSRDIFPRHILGLL